MNQTTISEIADKVTARWSEESWQVAREDAFDGADQDAIVAAADDLGVDEEECLASIQDVYDLLRERAASRNVTTVYVVRDASGEYLRANGRRTPASNEAAEYETRGEAEAACTRATDRVLSREAEAV